MSLNHQPISAPITMVKKEVIEEASPKKSSKIEIIAPVATQNVEVKQEISSKTVNVICQSQIDTDQCDTESEQEERLVMTRSRKRLFCSDSESENEAQKKKVKKKKKRKDDRIALPPKVSNIVRSSDRKSPKPTEKPIQQEVADEEEKKVSDLKKLIKKLSEGDTKNPNELLHQFESIIGKEGFSTLKSLFVGESTTSVQQKTEEKMNESEFDDQPLSNRLSKYEETKKKNRKKKKKSELEKLQDDIMEMYIRDGVMSAHGLRNHKRIPYVENEDSRTFLSEDESMPDDNESINCQKGSSFGDRSEKEPTPSDTNNDESEDEANKTINLKDLECHVVLEKLCLKGLKMPVKVSEDGTIKPLPEQVKDNKTALPTLKTKQPVKASEDRTIKTFPKADKIPLPTLKEVASKTESKTTSPGEITPVKDKTTLNNNLKETKSQKNLSAPPMVVIPTPNKTAEDLTTNCESEVITIDDDDENDTKPTPTKEDFRDKIMNHLMKKETPSPVHSKTIQSLEKTVCNLSFINCRSGVMLKCNAEKCQFERPNHQLFQYHIQTRHLLIKWSGFCDLCKKSVSNFGSLLDEYNHMYNEHILIGDVKTEIKPEIKSSDEPDQPDQPLNRKRGRKKNEDSLFRSLSKRVSKPAEKIVYRTVNESPEIIEKLLRNSATKKKNLPVKPEISSTVAELEKPLTNPEPAVNLTSVDANAIRTYSRATKDISSEASNHPVELAASKPKIVLKIRSLPGDKLSSVNRTIVITSVQDTSEVPVIKDDMIKHKTENNEKSKQSESQVSSQVPSVSNGNSSKLVQMLQFSQTLKNTSGSPDSQETTSLSRQPIRVCREKPTITKTNKLNDPNNTKCLRPWLDAHDRKDPAYVKSMLEEECLVDLYKCMGSRCNYHTKDLASFVSHLKAHGENLQMDSILRCPYCNISVLNVAHAANHIQNEHKFDRYACAHCFYRSVVEVHVVAHQTEYHREGNNTVLDCLGERINIKEASYAVFESRSKFISPILCVCKFII